MLTTSEMPRGDSYFLQGQQGGIVATATAPSTVTYNGPFRVILAIDDANVDVYDGDTLLFGLILKPGTSVQTRMSHFEILDGTAIAYYA